MKILFKIFFLFFILLNTSICHCQSNPIKKVFYDQQLIGIKSNLKIPIYNSVIVLGNQGYGNYTNGTGLVIKTDSALNIVWGKKINLNGHFIDAVSSKDSSFAAVGYYIDSVSGPYKTFCIKFKPNGDIDWSKSISNGSNSLNPNSISNTNDSGFAICGHYLPTGSVDTIAFTVKLDKNGNLLWFKSLKSISIGNTFIARAIKESNDKGLIVIGGMNAGGGVFMIKLSKNGNIIWSKEFLGLGAKTWTAMDLLIENNKIVCAFNTTSLTLLQTDTSGNIIWSKSSPISSYVYGSNYPKCFRMKSTPDKGYLMNQYSTNNGFYYYVNGYTNWIFKTDSMLNKSYFMFDRMANIDVIQLKNKKFIISGNGPVLQWAIKTTSVEANQIGLTVSDSLNIGCYISRYTDTVKFFNSSILSSILSFTAISGGTYSTLSFTSSIINIMFENNCVFNDVRGGIATNSIDKFKILPNPVQNKFSINIGDVLSGKITVHIFDCVGKLVMKEEMVSEKSSFEFDSSRLQSGIYFCKIYLNDEFIVSKKIIKE